MSVRRFFSLLEERTGLEWTEGLPLTAISDHLTQRALALGLGSPDAYAARLVREDEADTACEWQAVLDVATNGQTWFFRGEPQLVEFQHVLRRLGRSGRALRIWAAACSTGEEVYTLAMLAAEAEVNVAILGTDLNAASIARAERGNYTLFTLRHVSDARRTRFFKPCADGSFEVRKSLLGGIQFEQHNLVRAAPKRPTGGGPAWDVIFCRNVFIYFSEETIADVGRALSSVLDDDGILFLGASESFRSYDVPLDAELFDESVAYRRRPSGSPRVAKARAAPSSSRIALRESTTRIAAASPAPPSPGKVDVKVTAKEGADGLQDDVLRNLLAGNADAARDVARRAMSVGSRMGPLLLGHVELRAHQLDRALDAYLEAARRAPASCEPPFFQAVVHHKQRKWSDALLAAERAIHNNRNCWPALFLTIGIHGRLGGYSAATEARIATRKALAQPSAGAPFETSKALLRLIVPSLDEVERNLDVMEM